MSINTGVSLRSIKDIMKNIISPSSNTRVSPLDDGELQTIFALKS